MKRLLFHSYHFPPIGGSGAQRPLKMVRYLLDHDYMSTVVTGGGATADRWAPEDATLDAEIPRGVEVIRLPRADEPETSSRWRGRAERWLRLDVPWARWWIEGSVDAARELATRSDLIYCWMQPYASAEAASRLSALSRKPWVADLGDPWALDEMMVYPTALHRRAEVRRMGEQLATASAIVMSTPEAAKRVVETFPHLRDRPVVAIPNGYDAADFAEPAEVVRGDKFRIVHTGYLHTELGREFRRALPIRSIVGGHIRGIDILSRSHVYLIQALNRLVDREPDVTEHIELHLAGVLNATDLEIANTCRVTTRIHGYLSHTRSLALVRTADLLFLPMQSLPAGQRATIVPGKTYEYLASGRPILAAVPAGDAHDMLESGGTADVCDPVDIECLALTIAARIAAWRRGEPAAELRREVVEPFEYARLARRLADVFDYVIRVARGE